MFHSSTLRTAEAPAAHGTRTAYRDDIDGLRAVAVLAVVIHHIAPAILPGGYVGVDIFFVISGYVITKIIHAELMEGVFTFAGFYARRARRILPALFAVLLASLGVGYLIQLPSDDVFAVRAAAASVFSVSNILFWRSSKAYFDETDEKLNPLLHTRSLGVEEQFYLFFPLILLPWMRLPRSIRLALFVAASVASLRPGAPVSRRGLLPAAVQSVGVHGRQRAGAGDGARGASTPASHAAPFARSDGNRRQLCRLQRYHDLSGPVRRAADAGRSGHHPCRRSRPRPSWKTISVDRQAVNRTWRVEVTTTGREREPRAALRCGMPTRSCAPATPAPALTLFGAEKEPPSA
jgi:hypothetical protein